MAEVLVDRTAYSLQRGTGQTLAGQGGQQRTQVFARVVRPAHVVQAVIELDQLLGLEAPVGQRGIKRIGCTDMIAGQRQVDTQLARQTRQEVAATDIRVETDAHLGHAHTGRLGDHPEGRTLYQPHSTAQDKAIHQRQHGLGIVVNVLIEPVFLGQEHKVLVITAQVAFIEHADITARAKRLLAVGTQHHSQHLGVFFPGLEMLIEQTNHRQRQGIEPCRPIQRQVPDAVAHLGYDRQIVLAHDQLSCL
ncbi:hypothetical protein D9M73_180910 [compost metagenome]